MVTVRKPCYGVLHLANLLFPVCASLSQDHLRLEGEEGVQEGVLGERYVTLSYFLLLGNSLVPSSYRRPGYHCILFAGGHSYWNKVISTPRWH